MLFCFLLIYALFIGSFAEEDVHLPACPIMTEETLPKYHVDSTCDRVAQNSPERRLQRQARYEMLRKAGLSQVPNQLTVTCPQEPVDLTMGQVGQDTTWVVENKSSGKVVVAYINSGVEYSAMNPSITPPQADPKAILQPGEWKSIYVFEGHVFHVREILADGSAGNILLQHRSGLIGFTNRFQKELDCDDMEDIEPMVEVQSQELPTSAPDNAKTAVPDKTSPTDESTAHQASMNTIASNTNILDQALEVPLQEMSSGPPDSAKTTALDETSTMNEPAIHQTSISTIASNVNVPDQATEVRINPNYERAPVPYSEHCNIVYQGFRNLQRCPLNVYYVGIQEATSNGPMECAEEFKFHLGFEDANDAKEWVDRHKFEGTFMGHTFVARLSSNLDVLVDTFTMQPTEIHDCPGLEQKPVTAVVENTRVQLGVNGRQNATNMDVLSVLSSMVNINVATK